MLLKTGGSQPRVRAERYAAGYERKENRPTDDTIVARDSVVIRVGGSVKPGRRKTFGRLNRGAVRRHGKEGKQQANCRNDPKSAEDSI